MSQEPAKTLSTRDIIPRDPVTGEIDEIDPPPPPALQSRERTGGEKGERLAHLAEERAEVLASIQDALETRGYFHMANGRDIGLLLDAAEADTIELLQAELAALRTELSAAKASAWRAGREAAARAVERYYLDGGNLNAACSIRALPEPTNAASADNPTGIIRRLGYDKNAVLWRKCHKPSRHVGTTYERGG